MATWTSNDQIRLMDKKLKPVSVMAEPPFNATVNWLLWPAAVSENVPPVSEEMADAAALPEVASVAARGLGGGGEVAGTPRGAGPGWCTPPPPPPPGGGGAGWPPWRPRAGARGKR